MAFLKNMAIKSTTRKRATMLWKGLDQTISTNPEMSLKDALAHYLKKNLELGAAFSVGYFDGGLVTYDLSSFLGALEKWRKDEKMEWSDMFTLVTIAFVFEELSYDKSIGA